MNGTKFKLTALGITAMTPDLDFQNDNNDEDDDEEEDDNEGEPFEDQGIGKEDMVRNSEMKLEKSDKSEAPSKFERGYRPPVINYQKRVHCTVDNCQYSTPYAKDLARHMRKHTGEKPYRCPTCPKAFSRNDKLKQHMMTHATVKPFKCDIDSCNYATIDMGSLRKHQRVHTNERPYKCQLCPYQGKDSSQLVVHLRHHTGDTPYVCTYDACTSAFKTPSDLQRHTRIHTKVKPYKCPHCDYRAAVKCNLNTHVRKNHPQPSEYDLIPSTISTVFDDQDKSSSSLNFMDETRSSQVNNHNVSSNNRSSNSQGDEAVLLLSTMTENGLSPTESLQVEAPRKKKSARAIVNNNKNAEVVVEMDLLSAPSVETGQILTPLQKKKKVRTKNKLEINEEQLLAFTYACRMCSYKGENYKAFKKHMQRKHKDVLQLPFNNSLPEPISSVTTDITRNKRFVYKANVPKKYPCTKCTVSFAREDSLRCHLRQHNKVSPSVTSLTFSSSRIISNPAQKVYVIVNPSGKITTTTTAASTSTSESSV